MTPSSSSDLEPRLSTFASSRRWYSSTDKVRGANGTGAHWQGCVVAQAAPRRRWLEALVQVPSGASSRGGADESSERAARPVDASIAQRDSPQPTHRQYVLCFEKSSKVFLSGACFVFTRVGSAAITPPEDPPKR